jgi:thiol-disulfide isomerase/thioredoxin
MDETTNDDNAPAEAETEGAGEPRVITLGWPVLVLPLLAFAVIAGAYFLGQRGGLIGAAPAPTPVYQIVANSEVPPAIIGPGGGPVTGLPERYHPLTDTKAPDFQMAVLGGTDKMKLSDYAGKPVLVNFWATWCPPCRYEMPWLMNVYNKYKDQGFVVLGVDAGEKVPGDMVESTVKQYVETSGLTFPVLLDEGTYQLQGAWGVSGLPSSFVINPKGTITYVHTGMFPDEATLESLVQKILPGGEWENKEPVGAQQQGTGTGASVASQP